MSKIFWRKEHLEEVSESSRGLSEAIPPESHANKSPPRRGGRKLRMLLTILAPLLGAVTLYRLPGVSLRSTPGYFLTTLWVVLLRIPCTEAKHE